MCSILRRLLPSRISKRQEITWLYGLNKEKSLGWFRNARSGHLTWSAGDGEEKRGGRRGERRR